MRQELRDRIQKIKNEEVPEGYYQFGSEILPKTWIIKDMKCICERNFVGIATSTTQHFRNKGVPLIRNQNIMENRLNTDEILNIAEEFDEANKNKRIQENDILTVRTGFAGISCVVPKTFNNAQTFTTLISRPNLNKVNPFYLCYYINSNLGKSKMDGLAYGNAQKNLNVAMIETLEVILPTLLEQQKIATILSTWDKAIELKEKFIKEKKKQKDGLMQKLLTGEVRLPGFDGEWKEFQIKDLLDYEQPSKYIVNEILDYSPNLTPVLTANKSFILGSTMEKQGVYKEIPVIIFDDFTMDSKYVDFEFKVKSSAIKILIAKENKSDIKFMYELIQFVDVPKGNHKRYYISEYQEQYVFVPELVEQIAISTVALTADKQIDLLTQELDLLKLQKKGLMQLLLTGIVRVNTEN